MPLYRSVWTPVAGAVTAVAAAVVLVAHGPAVLAAEVVLVSVAGLVAGHALQPDPRRRWETGCRVAVGASATTLVAVGLGELVGPVALLVALLGAATHPAGVAAVVGGAGARRCRRAALPAGDLTLLDERVLLRMWRESDARMRRCWDTPVAAAELADTRRRLLDELLRRDPARTTAWWP